MVIPIYMYFGKRDYLLDEMRIFQMKYIISCLTISNLLIS